MRTKVSVRLFRKSHVRLYIVQGIGCRPIYQSTANLMLLPPKVSDSFAHLRSKKLPVLVCGFAENTDITANTLMHLTISPSFDRGRSVCSAKRNQALLFCAAGIVLRPCASRRANASASVRPARPAPIWPSASSTVRACQWPASPNVAPLLLPSPTEEPAKGLERLPWSGWTYKLQNHSLDS